LYGNSNFNNNLGAPGKILIFKLWVHDTHRT
jgi:hypothetical protein